jgi:hypothetical protein
MPGKAPAFQLYASDFYMDTLEWDKGDCLGLGIKPCRSEAAESRPLDLRFGARISVLYLFFCRFDESSKGFVFFSFVQV